MSVTSSAKSARAMHAPRRTHESRSGRAAVFPEETFFYANKIIEIIRRANVSVLTSADKSIRYVVNPTRRKRRRQTVYTLRAARVGKIYYTISFGR